MPDSLVPQSLQVFFGLPLGLAPSTSYSILVHFFTQSLSSFAAHVHTIATCFVYLTYWSRKSVTGFTHHDSFHQIWSWYNRLLLTDSILPAHRLHDPVTLTFWASTVVMHGRSCAQPLHQIQDPRPIHSWAMNYDVSHDNAFAATTRAPDHVTGM